MKKFISMAMAGCMALSLAACGGSSASTAESTATSTEATSEAAASGSKTDVAFVTDVGNIDDQSFNQYTWQGVQDFCSANSLNANYYRPTEDSDAARLEQMDNAVNDGAKAVVVAGYLFGSSIAEAQAKYPDVEFLALDVSTSDLGDTTPAENTALITYKEEQAGYLAGYAAVYDGYKELGFLGGMASCRALTLLLRSWALTMSTSSTGTPAASLLPMRSRTRWTAGTLRVPRSSLPAAAPSARAATLLLRPTAAR